MKDQYLLKGDASLWRVCGWVGEAHADAVLPAWGPMWIQHIGLLHLNLLSDLPSAGKDFTPGGLVSSFLCIRELPLCPDERSAYSFLHSVHLLLFNTKICALPLPVMPLNKVPISNASN